MEGWCWLASSETPMISMFFHPLSWCAARISSRYSNANDRNVVILGFNRVPRLGVEKFSKTVFICRGI